MADQNNPKWVADSFSIDKYDRLLLGPQSQLSPYDDVTLISAVQSAVGTSFEDIGNFFKTNGMNVRAELGITDNDSTVFELRALFSRTDGGATLEEEKYDGSMEILTPRIHTLNPTIIAAGDLVYALINTAGFEWCKLQARFTTPSGTAGDIDTAIAVLV